MHNRKNRKNLGVVLFLRILLNTLSNTQTQVLRDKILQSWTLFFSILFLYCQFYSESLHVALELNIAEHSCRRKQDKSSTTFRNNLIKCLMFNKNLNTKQTTWWDIYTVCLVVAKWFFVLFNFCLHGLLTVKATSWKTKAATDQR